MNSLDSLYETIGIDEVRAENERLMADDYFESPNLKDLSIIGSVSSFFAFDHRVRFFSEFMTLLRFVPDPKIGTAGVAVRKGQFIFVYRPQFIASLPIPELRFLFIHEILHIALGHCTSRSSNVREEHKRENAMMDLAINSISKQLCEDREKGYAVTKLVETIKITEEVIQSMFDDPKEVTKESLALVRSKMGKPFGLYPQEDYSPPYAKFDNLGSGEGKLKSYEWYWNNCPVDPNEGYGGACSLHSGWSDDQSAAEKVKITIDKIDSCGGWGAIGAELQDAIRSAQVAKVPWHRLFKLALGSWGRFLSQETRTTPHKILGYDAPGSKTHGRDAILFCRDTSASVVDIDQAHLLAEINGFQRKFGRVFLTDFDTEIHNDPPRTWDRKLAEDTIVGRGGTNFDIIMDKLVVRTKGWGFKHVVMLTDGECSYPELPRGVKFIWVITKGGQRPPYQEGSNCKIVMM